MKPIFSNFPILVLFNICPAIASDQLFIADKLRSKCRVRIIPLRRKKKSATDFFFHSIVEFLLFDLETIARVNEPKSSLQRSHTLHNK